ncbi:hypothetical protein BKK51_07230 [Rodentibacter trehalosifermentans]|uniref:Major facilitator superfamily (MFS) profile domain-containing protein n=1 Tax=Rodentibacter trehalosifermentans TaxID=1908263 RepID=A0A1V3ISI0_9PAST|nr:MFS transporter [Rodentibacter trehalosifermentans]OOF45215.1 hypothetical protein BKK51_07230 [Rodentibacter trehalosifermentans]
MKSALNLFSLFCGQALSGSVISLLTLSSTLVGNALSPQDFLVSLPITMTVLGSAITVYFASFLMAKYGRRTAFIVSGFIGIVGALLAIYAIYNAQFYLFSLAAFILGSATVFNQYYRFAAAEVFNNEGNKKRATSLIISAGIIGGVLGPFLAEKGANLLAVKYVGIFWLCLAVFVLLIISQLFLSIKNPPVIYSQNQSIPKGIFLQKEFKIGTACSAFSFAIMVLLMNATPLAMHHQHFQLEQISPVLQWHFVAMYSPALLLPFMVKKVSNQSIIGLGCLLFIIGGLCGLFFQQHWGYFLALMFIGAGWGVMFSGGTFLLNQLSPQHKHKLQGISSLITYLANLTASFSVGLLMTIPHGWQIANLSAVIFMSIFSLWLFYQFKKMKT